MCCEYKLNPADTNILEDTEVSCELVMPTKQLANIGETTSQGTLCFQMNHQEISSLLKTEKVENTKAADKDNNALIA